MIKVENLKISFGDRDIFSNVSFVLNRGEKVGLVGDNGSGKTTLLKIIIGEIKPDEGSVVIDKKERIGYLPQILETDFEKSVKEFFSEEHIEENWRIKKYLGEVGMQNIELSRKLSAFSGGELVKIGLARIIAKEPTTLLLDEPTNNLDFEGINLLKRFLSSFKGGVLLISHDRWLLDEITSRIIDLQLTDEGRRSRIYSGNFTDYKRVKEEERNRQESLYQLQQKKIKKISKNIKELKERAKTVDRSTLSKLHEDGVFFRSLSDKFDRAAKVREKKLEKFLDSEERIKKPLSEKKLSFHFGNYLEKGQRALEVKDISFSFKTKKILKKISLNIYGKDKIALLGANGSGKTTFLRILTKEIKLKEGKIEWNQNINIGYLPQEISFHDEKKTVLSEFEKGLEIPEGEARRLLGKFLFSGRKQSEKIYNLSAGEKRRLYLAKIVALGANFLLLDEPTNHFDIQSNEAVEQALSQFEGAILVVSHDRYFLKNIKVKKFYLLDNGMFKEIYSLEHLKK